MIFINMALENFRLTAKANKSTSNKFMAQITTFSLKPFKTKLLSGDMS